MWLSLAEYVILAGIVHFFGPSCSCIILHFFIGEVDFRSKISLLSDFETLVQKLKIELKLNEGLLNKYTLLCLCGS